MKEKVNRSAAFALAFYMLVLLPLAFVIHSHTHSHTFKYAAADQWQDEDASHCQLCVDYFHQIIDHSKVFSIDFYTVKYPFQFFPLWISGYTASPNLLYLRGPPSPIC